MPHPRRGEEAGGDSGRRNAERSRPEALDDEADYMFVANEKNETCLKLAFDVEDLTAGTV